MGLLKLKVDGEYLAVAQGPAGPIGPQGEQGIQGETGPAGSDATSQMDLLLNNTLTVNGTNSISITGLDSSVYMLFKVYISWTSLSAASPVYTRLNNESDSLSHSTQYTSTYQANSTGNGWNSQSFGYLSGPNTTDAGLLEITYWSENSQYMSFGGRHLYNTFSHGRLNTPAPLTRIDWFFSNTSVVWPAGSNFLVYGIKG